MALITNRKGDSMVVIFNLFDLKQKLQLFLKTEVSLSQIARDADLHRNTVERIFNNKTDRIDLETIGKLLLYFQAQGLDVHIDEIFLVEKP